MLGLNYTSVDRSLIDMAYSMIERGVIPKKSKYREQPIAPPPIAKQQTPMIADYRREIGGEETIRL